MSIDVVVPIITGWFVLVYFIGIVAACIAVWCGIAWCGTYPKRWRFLVVIAAMLAVIAGVVTWGVNHSRAVTAGETAFADKIHDAWPQVDRGMVDRWATSLRYKFQDADSSLEPDLPIGLNGDLQTWEDWSDPAKPVSCRLHYTVLSANEARLRLLCVKDRETVVIAPKGK